MKATELMIGDLIRIGDNVGEICSISAANHKYPDLIEYTLVGKFNESTHTIGLERVLPIPLTEEILEKNGFEVSSEHARFYFEENGYDDGEIKHSFVLRKMYRIDNTKEQKGWAFYAFNVLSLIDYVHELQHALRLCGIEKEIIL